MKCKGKNIAKVGDGIVKTNVYRCTEYCPNCPFLDDGKAIKLNDGRVDNIKKDLLNGDNFVCHKTVYSLDNNMNSLEEEIKRKMCYGAYQFLLKEQKPNKIMTLATALGVENQEGK